MVMFFQLSIESNLAYICPFVVSRYASASCTHSYSH